jgi:hypothetical protein
MNICQGVGNIFIVAIDGTNSVHIFEPTGLGSPQPQECETETSDCSSYFPNMTLSPSHAAPMRPVTSTVMTALNI